MSKPGGGSAATMRVMQVTKPKGPFDSWNVKPPHPDPGIGLLFGLLK